MNKKLYVFKVNYVYKGDKDYDEFNVLASNIEDGKQAIKDKLYYVDDLEIVKVETMEVLHG